MALLRVSITSEALLTCMTHALSTEREEVMGLLIGNSNIEGECKIYTVFPMPRSDKRRDRVEVSEDNLISASSQCEKLSAQMNIQLRVVGWFHSHPHITVWPSHVDLRTQAMYQLLEPNYVGLIISAFNTDKVTKSNRLEVVAFQSLKRSVGSPNEYERIELPICVTPQVVPFDSLSSRERSMVKQAADHSRLRANSDSLLLNEAEKSFAYSFSDTYASVSLSSTCLIALCEVARLFSDEEKAAYLKAINRDGYTDQNAFGSTVTASQDEAAGTNQLDATDVLARVYNTSVYNTFMSQLLSTFELPLVAALRSQCASLNAECDQLESRRNRLQREIEAMRRQRPENSTYSVASTSRNKQNKF